MKPYGEPIAQLDLFSAAFHVYYTLWMVAATRRHPGCLVEDREKGLLLVKCRECPTCRKPAEFLTIAR